MMVLLQVNMASPGWIIYTVQYTAMLGCVVLRVSL